MSLQHTFGELREQLAKRIIGQEKLVDRLLIALLADGHLLVEGAPGLAKTTAIKALADHMEGDFHRIQFTPDLLPSDVMGSEIYRPETGQFEFQRGPIFHNLVLADEINRAPAKVQSALLEAMGERQISVGMRTFPLDRLFLVVWPKHTLYENLQMRGSMELDNDGPEAFYQYLLDYPLGNFNPHSKPLQTRARDRVVEFSLPNFEVFFRDWEAGDLEAPFISCTTRDLYLYYRRWCNETGNRPLTETKLITIFSSRLEKSREWFKIKGVKYQSMMFVVNEPPPEKPKMDVLGSCVEEFRRKTAKMELD